MSFCKIFSVNCRAKPPDNVEAISMRLKIEIPYHLDMLNNPEFILCQGKFFTNRRKHFERKATKDSVCARIEWCFVDIRCCFFHSIRSLSVQSIRSEANVMRCDVAYDVIRYASANAIGISRCCCDALLTVCAIVLVSWCLPASSPLPSSFGRAFCF